MKNKKLMYVLLAASALVWGWVFVKIFSVFFKNDDNSINVKRKTIAAQYTIQADTFELLANYRDPFLKKASGASGDGYVVNTSGARPRLTAGASGNTRAVQEKKKSVVAEVKSEHVIDWGFIKYTGRITRQSTGKILSLVTINGNDYSLEDGKTVHNVSLLKSAHDSILVSYEGVKKYIIRNRN